MEVETRERFEEKRREDKREQRPRVKRLQDDSPPQFSLCFQLWFQHLASSTKPHNNLCKLNIIILGTKLKPSPSSCFFSLTARLCWYRRYLHLDERSSSLTWLCPFSMRRVKDPRSLYVDPGFHLPPKCGGRTEERAHRVFVGRFPPRSSHRRVFFCAL